MAAMTPAAYRATLAGLGISQARLSRLLDADKSTPNRWATGAVPVPRAIVLLLQAWLAHPELIPTEGNEP